MIKTINSIKSLLPTEGMPARQENFQMFKVGVLLCTPGLERTVQMRPLADALNIKPVVLSMAKSMAKRYDCDIDKFMLEVDRVGSDVSWNRLTQILAKKRRGSQEVIKGLKQLTAYIVMIANEAKSMDADEKARVYDTFKSVRKILDKHAPYVDEVADKNFLRYSTCCCCGTYPPPDGGFNLVEKQHNMGYRIFYPVCHNCATNGIQPSDALIADVYAGYAYGLEQAIDKIVGIE